MSALYLIDRPAVGEDDEENVVQGWDENRRDSLARIGFGATAAIAFFGLLLAAIMAYPQTDGFFSEGWKRALNTLAFFTNESNLIVAITCVLLALNLDRRSTVFRAARFCGLVAITVTGVGYHWLLSETHHPEGWVSVWNIVLHYLVPIMAASGFLLFGPRGLFSAQLITYVLGFIAAWGAFTLIRGSIVDWYPYPFVDVIEHGYGRVVVNAVGLTILCAAVGLLYVFLDRALSKRAR